MRRHRPTLALGVLGALTGCGGAGSTSVECLAEYPRYGDAEESAAPADVIVRGTVTGSREREAEQDEGAVEGRSTPMTVLTLEVTDVVEGAVARGESLMIRHRACEAVGIDAADVGADHVLVLSRIAPGEALHPTTSVQGVYRVRARAT